MRHFDFKDGEMFAEGVPLSDIARTVGTPVYVYSTATLERHFNVFDNAFPDRDVLVAYSVKANSNLAVLATLARLGAGADVVSEGELIRALTAGIPPDKIVFSGVGKTRREMRAALTAGIRVFNVESQAELLVLNEVAQDMNVTAPVAFRINPDVSAGGHEKISTGKAENKFGIAWHHVHEAYDEAASLPGIEIVGVDMHIGSQITDLAPFKAAILKLRGLISELRDKGHNIRFFDLGGGLGIPYGNNEGAPPLPDAYGQMVRELTHDLDIDLIFEPGRMIAGNAGVLLSEVIYVKEGADRNFLILDAAMNDLIRPSLYDAFHDIEPVKAPGVSAEYKSYDVVGPVCETGDTFAKHRELSEVKAGDLMVIHTAGAYGAVQASQYNTRPLIPEVLVNGDKFEVIRERPSYDEILRSERIPTWLTKD